MHSTRTIKAIIHYLNFPQMSDLKIKLLGVSADRRINISLLRGKLDWREKTNGLNPSYFYEENTPFLPYSSSLTNNFKYQTKNPGGPEFNSDYTYQIDSQYFTRIYYHSKVKGHERFKKCSLFFFEELSNAKIFLKSIESEEFLIDEELLIEIFYKNISDEYGNKINLENNLNFYYFYTKDEGFLYWKYPVEQRKIKFSLWPKLNWFSVNISDSGRHVGHPIIRIGDKVRNM